MDDTVVTVAQAVERIEVLDLVSDQLPLALVQLHRVTIVGEVVRLRLHSGWDPHRLRFVVEGGGFSADAFVPNAANRRGGFDIAVTRKRTLPDTVGPGMQALLVGLNPSVYSADAGIGFARPGNRFWAAASVAVEDGKTTLSQFEYQQVKGGGTWAAESFSSCRSQSLASAIWRPLGLRLERANQVPPWGVAMVTMWWARAPLVPARNHARAVIIRATPAKGVNLNVRIESVSESLRHELGSSYY